MEEKKLLCPYCKNDKFIRKMTAGVSMYNDGDSIRDEIDWEEVDCYLCEKCEKEISEEELSGD